MAAELLAAVDAAADAVVARTSGRFLASWHRPDDSVSTEGFDLADYADLQARSTPLERQEADGAGDAGARGQLRHMLALLYSARSVRDVTIANATNLSRGEQPASTMFNDDRIQLDGSGMPLRELVFSESCAEVLRAHSRFGVDRNATFWPGAIDYIGRQVEASRGRAPREVERPLPQWARDALRAPRL